MKFLIISDNSVDRELITKVLQKEFSNSVFVNIIQQEDFDESIARGDFDAAIVECCLNWANGSHLIKRITERLPFIPIILIANMWSEEIVAEGMKSGLRDLILKKNLHHLPAILKERLEMAKLHTMYDEIKEKYHSLMDDASEAILISDIEGNLLDVSKKTVCLSGYTKEELIRMNYVHLYSKEDNERVLAAFKEVAQKGSCFISNISMLRKDGQRIPVDLTGSIIQYSGKREILFTTRDITEHKRFERCCGIHAAMRILAEAATLNEAIPKILQVICENLGWSLGEYWSMDTKTNLLRLVEIWCKPSIKVPAFVAQSRQTAFSPGTGLPGRIYTGKKPVWITDVVADSNFQWATVASKEGLRGALGFPIMAENEIFGVFIFLTNESQPRDNNLLRVLTFIGAETGQFIKRKQTEEALNASNARYRILFENSPISLWEEDCSEVKAYIDNLRKSGVADFRVYFENHPEEVHKCVMMVRVIDVNKTTLKMYGAKSKKVLLRGLSRRFDEESLNVYKAALISLAEGHTSFEAEAATLIFGGAKNYVYLSLTVAPGFEHTWAKIFVSLTDITERKRAEEALRRRIDLEKAVVNISTRFTILSDFNNAVSTSLADIGLLCRASRAYLFQFRNNGTIMDNTHEWCNAGVTPEIQNLQNLSVSLFPWGMAALHANSVIHIPDVSQLPPDAAAEKNFLEKQGIKSLLVLPVCAEKELVGFIGFDKVVSTGSWCDEDIDLLRITAEIIGNAIARKRSEAIITHMAYHDSLTGLPNRNLFQDRLQVAVVHAKRSERMVAVLLLDLDNFKTVNDSLGHHTGDLLLKAVAARLTQCVREGDTIARTGGDEFTIILPEITYAVNAAIVTNKILDTLCKPFQLEGHEIHTTASIGISLYPLDADTTEDLIKNADIAMYLSKECGKNTYRFFKTDMNTHI